MAVIHIDVDRFFLAVHAQFDRSVREGPGTPPIALFQYNDVICVSASARALGVRKHMSPEAARAVLTPAGGRLVHAFWRDWPGPRTWYKPYQDASRDLFACIRASLDAGAACGSTLERASIDEGYVSVEERHGPESVAEELVRSVRERLGLPVCCGVAPNKLLAKLASSAAKASGGGSGASGRVYAVRSDEEAQALLRQTAAHRLPGLGSRADALARAGIEVASQLQTLDVPRLQAVLSLSPAAAAAAHDACRGVSSAAVVDAPPKSYYDIYVLIRYVSILD